MRNIFKKRITITCSEQDIKDLNKMYPIVPKQIEEYKRAMEAVAVLCERLGQAQTDYKLDRDDEMKKKAIAHAYNALDWCASRMEFASSKVRELLKMVGKKDQE